MENSIYQSRIFYNQLKQLNLCRIFSQTVIKHVLAILVSVFSSGYHGKTTDFEKYSPCHRTTVAHFLNKGVWDERKLGDTLKESVVQVIYGEALRSGKPVFCIVDDTISSRTKPSSQAFHPIEDAYFHQSHLKGKQDYGHQAVSVMLSCNGIVLNYAVILYNKTKSKIKIVQDIAEELPIPPVISYFLCDRWYTSTSLMDAFVKKGFYTIGAIRTNRIIYPHGFRQSIRETALLLQKTKAAFHLVTVGSRSYYVYRYEGNLHGVENAIVLISYPKEALHDPGALRAFISTDVSLSTAEILDNYLERWPIEVFFRQSKGRLAFDRYQIRSSKGIQRYWLLMSLAHFIACTGCGKSLSFEEGYAYFYRKLQEERITYVYQCGKKQAPLANVLALIA